MLAPFPHPQVRHDMPHVDLSVGKLQDGLALKDVLGFSCAEREVGLSIVGIPNSWMVYNGKSYF